MTGPEHFREAERLIQAANDLASPRINAQTQMIPLAAAQVHATLALAAATALGDRNDPNIGGMHMDQLNEEWAAVLGP